jgi:hypothetical protein
MKIADFNEIIPERKNINLKTEPIDSNSDTRRYSARKTDSYSINALTTHIRNVRNLIDAISISLIAQSLIQKAITISSRLRNISQEALITGKIDTPEYDRSISDINASLRGIDNIYTSPILRAYSDIRTGDTKRVNVNSKLPDIRNEIDFLINLTSKRGILEKNEIEKIDRTINSLKEVMEKIDIPPFMEMRQISYKLTDYDNSMNARDSQKIIKKVGSQILNNPEMALAAQGNIHAASVANLFLS